MRRLIFLFVTLISFYELAFAQAKSPFSAGSWELNLSGSLGSFNSTYESNSRYGSSSTDHSYSYFQITAIPGIFVTDGLSFEPEINCLLLQQSKPSFSLLGNIAYTFRFENQSFAPFVRIGYGISNSLQFPVQNGLLSRASDEMNIPIFNAGAGMKLLITDQIAFRAEANYRSLSYDREYSYLGYTSKSNYKYSFISMLLGFSVLM